MPLLLASANQHKIREFRALFHDAGLELIAPTELGLTLEVEETGSTYYENAMLKARAYAGAAGMFCLADDSGIEVDALDGEPGVFSARFGDATLTDEGRVSLLLDALAPVPTAERSARYRCVLVVAGPGGSSWSAEGVCEGSIATSPRGVNGFGYDPVFIVAGRNETMAELRSAEKDRISHRGRAFAALLQVLEAAHAPLEEAGSGGIRGR